MRLRIAGEDTLMSKRLVGKSCLKRDVSRNSDLHRRIRSSSRPLGFIALPMRIIVTHAGPERVTKDPRDFGGDMDKMREHLHKEAADRYGAGFISGLLNGISSSAFGSGQESKDTEGTSGLASAIGKLYRKLALSSKALAALSSGSKVDNSKTGSSIVYPPPEGNSLWDSEPELMAFWSEKGWTKDPRRRYCVEATLGLYWALQQGPLSSSATSTRNAKSPMPGGISCPLDLAAKLHALHGPLLCSPSDAAAVCKKMPEILEMDSAKVMRQMVSLKMLLPGADIARMLLLRPQILLDPALEDNIRPQLELLRTYLPGVNVDELVQEYPFIVYEEIESGLKAFRELWPNDIVDDTTLADSTHHELVLAIRALSDNGAPKKWAAGGME